MNGVAEMQRVKKNLLKILRRAVMEPKWAAGSIGCQSGAFQANHSNNNDCAKSTAPLVAQIVKNPLAKQELQETAFNPSLSQEDSLKEKMATHSSILAWRIPWTEEPGGLQSMAHKESDMTEAI